MQVVQMWPDDATKLYHLKAGTVFTVCHNDSTVDNNVYIAAQEPPGGASHRDVMNLRTGAISHMSVAVRTQSYLDAAVILKPETV